MDERSAQVLLHAVETYIRTGRPAGSSRVREQTGLPVSTATIRLILHELDEGGYLHQPYTSAGRIPTDKGYRYYVDYQRSTERTAAARRQLRYAYRQAVSRHLQLVGALAHAIATHTRAYVIAGTSPGGNIAHTGISYLLAGDGEEQIETLRELSTHIDRADELIERVAENATSTAQAYIGRENPFLPAVHTSLLERTVTGPGRRTTVVTILGPKRMPYQQYLRVLDEAGDFL